MRFSGRGAGSAGLRFVDLVVPRWPLLGDSRHIETHLSCNVAQGFNSSLLTHQCHPRIHWPSPILLKGVDVALGLTIHYRAYLRTSPPRAEPYLILPGRSARVSLM